MLESLLPGLVLVAVFVWLMIELRRRPSLLRQLEHELRQGPLRRHLEHAWRFRLPVYSAETLQGKEAEFIRDRLRRKPLRPVLFMLAALGVFAILVWWATR